MMLVDVRGKMRVMIIASKGRMDATKKIHDDEEGIANGEIHECMSVCLSVASLSVYACGDINLYILI